MVIRVPALCLLDAVLVSFDVVSLFTNIPVDLAIRIAGDRLRDDSSLSDRSSLSPKEVETLLSFCINATYLAYREDFFQQTFGTAIGSPVSVTVADLVMEDVEQEPCPPTISLHPSGRDMWTTLALPSLLTKSTVSMTT